MNTINKNEYTSDKNNLIIFMNDSIDNIKSFFFNKELFKKNILLHIDISTIINEYENILLLLIDIEKKIGIEYVNIISYNNSYYDELFKLLSKEYDIKFIYINSFLNVLTMNNDIAINIITHFNNFKFEYYYVNILDIYINVDIDLYSKYLINYINKVKPKESYNSFLYNNYHIFILSNELYKYKILYNVNTLIANKLYSIFNEFSFHNNREIITYLCSQDNKYLLSDKSRFLINNEILLTNNISDFLFSYIYKNINCGIKTETYNDIIIKYKNPIYSARFDNIEYIKKTGELLLIFKKINNTIHLIYKRFTVSQLINKFFLIKNIKFIKRYENILIFSFFDKFFYINLYKCTIDIEMIFKYINLNNHNINYIQTKIHPNYIEYHGVYFNDKFVSELNNDILSVT